ncbi:MAG: F0F1 ATP synthase subunit B [Gammaproteobacteria bacterium]
MSINLTLIGQAITFLLFVWFTMKVVWPPLVKAMDDRQKKIADGLAAGERGQKELADAEAQIQLQVRASKQQASEIIEKAYRRADQIIEEAKEHAHAEGERLLEAAQSEVEQSMARARESLRKEMVALAISGAEQVLQSSVDLKVHNDVIRQLETQIG